MPSLVQQLKQQGGSLFDGRGTLLSLWQEICDQFFPSRADFILQRNLGTEFAANLMTSYPLIVHRDLANTFSSMLRPSAKDWFKTVSKRQDKVDTDGKQWLAWFTKMQKNAMYDRVAMFSRATKEADNDFAALGQAVLQCRYVRPKNGNTPHLHHRCWHLRDVAWSENEYGIIGPVYRKWHPIAFDVAQHFPDKVHEDTARQAREKPFETVEIWHCVLPTELFDSLEGVERIPQPYVQVFFDPHHEIVLELTGSWVMEYVIPRWATVSGSQYAHSPATIAALPDGRLIQSITRVLLEAGEKAVNPPIVGVREMIRSDLNYQAGGFTALDPEYEGKVSEALHQLMPETKGLNFGLELVKDIREQLKEAFFLNKLNLPPTQGGRDMTAYEVGQRVQEFIRNALPLFEPVETDYNGGICETDMKLILHNDPEVRKSIPDSLKMGLDLPDAFGFVFESPLREAVDKAKVGQWQEATQIITSAQALDQSAAFIIDGKKGLRDVLDAVVPADWLRSEDVVDKMSSDAHAAAKSQQLLDLLGQGGKAAKDLAAAGSDAADTMTTLGPA